jgi:hypothetical protein
LRGWWRPSWRVSRPGSSQAPGDGKVSPNDTIIMGKYPTKLAPTTTDDFADWGVKSHTVASVALKVPQGLVVTTTSGREHRWSFGSAIQAIYGEGQEANSSFLKDSILSPFTDEIKMVSGSPSQPVAVHPPPSNDYDDDDFFDLDFYYAP